GKFQTDFTLECKPQKRTEDFRISMIGEQNVENTAAVIVLLLQLGVDVGKLKPALIEFRGATRRQQILFENQQMVLMEDFAHHPTAIRVTLDGIRALYPKHEMWALFEPRSNTSTKNYLQKELIEALTHSDISVIYKVYRGDGIDPKIRLDRQAVKDE